MASKARITVALPSTLFLFFLASAFAPSASSSFSVSKQQQQKEFDYFLLALQWPGTYCKSTAKCCSSNGCCDSSVPLSEFTIHGLWPNYDDGSWPSCCYQWDFDLKKILPLIEELKKYWPSLSCSSSSLCQGGKGLFWAHEYEKHGTCSFPVIKNEYSYFATTLDLYIKYNITKILDGAGFVASNAESYRLKDVIGAIENGFGATPLVVCSKGAVEELRICFYKNLEPRDCDIGSNSITMHNALHSTSCPEYIRLPSYTSVAKGSNSTITWLADEEDTQAIIGLTSI